jgi:hypothetical protein
LVIVIAENLLMPQQKTESIFKLGDRVRIRLSGGQRGRIVELRGPLGPGGAQIYRVRIPRDPKPGYIEVREDQLVLIPPKPNAPQDDTASSSAPPQT